MTELIKQIKERSIFTVMINSNKKDSSAVKLNKKLTELWTEFLLKKITLNDDLYNINDQDKISDVRLHQNDNDKETKTEALNSSIIISSDYALFRNENNNNELSHQQDIIN